MSRALLFGVAAAALLVTMGAQGFKSLREKAEQQKQATEVIQRYKQSYKALAASTKAWDTRYPDLARYSDLLDLYHSIKLERYRLASDPDQLGFTKVEAVTFNGVNVGLVRMCLASNAANSSAAFAATSDSYESLLDGVRSLAERDDVEIGAISIRADGRGVPTAFLSDFCLLLRQEPTA